MRRPLTPLSTRLVFTRRGRGVSHAPAGGVKPRPYEAKVRSPTVSMASPLLRKVRQVRDYSGE